MFDRLTQQTAEHYRLREAISLRLSVAEDSIWLYEDISIFLMEVLRSCHSADCRLIAVAPVGHELAMAADRAEIEIIEAVLENPFVVDVESILGKVNSKRDIIFIANPNRVTGATLSLSQLQRLAAAVPEGLLVVDEFYNDFFKVTASPVTGRLGNVIVLRPFENWTMANSLDCGFAIIGSKVSGKLQLDSCGCAMSRSTVRCCYARFNDEKARVAQISGIQKQALHLASALTNFNVNCQITPADFILIEVRNSERVAEFMSQFNIQVEKLVEHPKLRNFLRYRLTGSAEESRLIEAFKKTPANYLGIKERPGRRSIETVDVLASTAKTTERTT